MQNDATALGYAVVYGYAKVARFLLENGAAIDFEDEVRRTDMIILIIILHNFRFGKDYFTLPVNKALVKLCQFCWSMQLL